MAYISTSHSVGSIVYAYDEDTDSVRRLRVIAVTAKSTDAKRYDGGTWDVEYTCKPAQTCLSYDHDFYSEKDLHDTPREAFPAITPEAAPIPTPEVLEAA